MWLLLWALVVGLVIVDKVLVAAVFKSLDPEEVPRAFFDDLLDVPVGLRVAFGCMLSPRVLAAMTMATLLTMAFMAVYVKWMALRKAGPADQKLAIRNVFVFNLGAMAALTVGQLWLDHEWQKP